jgi:hypothetical protein
MDNTYRALDSEVLVRQALPLIQELVERGLLEVIVNIEDEPDRSDIATVTTAKMSGPIMIDLRIAEHYRLPERHLGDDEPPGP